MPSSLKVVRILVLVAMVFLSVVATPVALTAPSAQYTYVTMADGVKISVSMTFPDGYDPSDPGNNPNNREGDPAGWPTLFQMDGYGGGGDDFLGSVDGRFDSRFVIVYASIRGTGCSGGRFDLFDRVHAEDGRTIIDQWIPQQPWFNGKVGIIGHSYPGLTGWLVSSTQPRELDVIAISGLIDDLYRGIVYPGGVPNLGFPLIWTAGARPAFEVAGNADRVGTDPMCARHIAERTADQNTVPGVFDNPIVQGATSQEDDTWYQMRSTGTYVKLINKPIHLTQQWQDEQTGPRGSHTLFERLPAGLPKRLVLTNGIHATTAVANADRLAWLTCWTYGNGSSTDSRCGGDVLDETKRVRIYFEQQGNSTPTNNPYLSGDWPLPETEWTRLYLHDDGSFSTTAGSEEESLSYASSSAGRHLSEEVGFASNPAGGEARPGRLTFREGPDELIYEYQFSASQALAGPINLTLRASSSAPDTDFFVDLLDIAPDGALSYLQRGLQRASHRQIDDLRSDFVQSGSEAGAYYRAHHPHTNTTLNLLTPGQQETFQIEIFPVGHVFRAGHKLQMRIHAPPPKDPISIYAWVSLRSPALNTIFHNGLSSILLPLISVGENFPIGDTPPACGSMAGVICFQPV